MLSHFLKNLSILKNFYLSIFLFFNYWNFNYFYLNSIKPTIIKNKTSNHVNVLNNTIENLNRLGIKFNQNDIKKIFIFNSISFSEFR